MRDWGAIDLASGVLGRSRESGGLWTDWQWSGPEIRGGRSKRRCGAISIGGVEL